MPADQRPDLTLAIETSNPSVHPGPGVALGRIASGRVEVLGVEPLAKTSRHDDDLMPAIDRLFAGLGASPRRVARVAVSVGPGGYTALRVAAATGKMIAEATGARCVAVPTALALALRVPEGAEPFAVLLAGKGDSAWAAVFEKGWRGGIGAGTGATGRIVTGAEVDGLGVRALIGDRFTPEPIRARAAELGVPVHEPVYDPSACLEASAHLPEIDPAALAPIYPREPDAVTLWRRLHGSEEGSEGRTSENGGNG